MTRPFQQLLHLLGMSREGVWSGGACRWLRAAAVVVMLVSVLFAGSSTAFAADGLSLKEHQVKAAFVYNFAKFVEWPSHRSTAGATNASPIVIGVAGKTPCTAELEQIVAGRKINGRDLVVRAVDSPEEARKVHILFVTAGEDERLEEWLMAGQDAGILTVGETDAFARQGGMIRFLIEADKIRFDVNMEAAEKAGLKLSAQLLKLARTVRRKD